MSRQTAVSRGLSRLRLTVLGACALLQASLVQAHGVRTDLILTVDAPAADSGLHVQLLQGHIQPQIVLENRSDQTMEIVGRDGKPFLRIGPLGVEADIRAPDFKASQNPLGGGEVAPTAARESLWRRLRSEPYHGWFDPRLDVADVVIPREVKAVDEPVPFARWEIPFLRAGGADALRGAIQYQPPPRGMAQPQILSALPKGLSITAVSGRWPLLLVENQQAETTLQWLDDQGTAFVEIGPDGVRADTGHPYWLRIAQAGEPSGQGWQLVSTQPRYALLEPRAAAPAELPRDSQARSLGRWSVPLRWGGADLSLAGENRWQPFPAETTTNAPPR